MKAAFGFRFDPPFFFAMRSPLQKTVKTITTCVRREGEYHEIASGARVSLWETPSRALANATRDRAARESPPRARGLRQSPRRAHDEDCRPSDRAAAGCRD